MTSNAAFKKQVRDLAGREQIPYADARTRLLGADAKRDAPADRGAAARARELDACRRLIGDVLTRHALELAAADAEYEDAELLWVQTRELEGLHVVEGGQTGRYNDDGTTPWEIHDWRTRALLAEGVSTYEDMTWEDNWIDIGRFDYDAELTPRVTLKSIAADAPPELYRFIEHLAGAMDGDWATELAEWISSREQ